MSVSNFKKGTLGKEETIYNFGRRQGKGGEGGLTEGDQTDISFNINSAGPTSEGGKKFTQTLEGTFTNG